MVDHSVLCLEAEWIIENMTLCRSHFQGKLDWKTFHTLQAWFVLRSRVKTYTFRNKTSHLGDK